MLPRIGGPRAFPLYRLNGSALENDAFSDKSERENAEDSDAETQDHSRKTNESGSDLLDSPGGPRRGTTYVEQVQEDLGEVRALSAESGNRTQQGVVTLSDARSTLPCLLSLRCRVDVRVQPQTNSLPGLGWSVARVDRQLRKDPRPALYVLGPTYT